MPLRRISAQHQPNGNSRAMDWCSRLDDQQRHVEMRTSHEEEVPRVMTRVARLLC